MHLIFLIVNKYGSLVYGRVLAKDQNAREYTADQLIKLGSTFHSLHAISQEITPESVNPVMQPGAFPSPVLEGINEIVADSFVFKCLQTLTGVKLLLATTNYKSTVV